jgi:hypothetical protein
MTVQELINELNKVKNKDIEVIVRGTDPTDWTYNNSVDGCEVEKVYFEDEDYEIDEDNEDDEDDEVGRECFVIDGGLF